MSNLVLLAVQKPLPPPPVNLDSFAKRLNWVLDCRKMSGVDLSKATGVVQQTISTYTSGLTQRPRKLERIADALGVNPTWLATGAGIPNIDPAQTPHAQEILSICARLSADSQATLLRLARALELESAEDRIANNSR